jgi:uncharacterized protein YfaS (alpha-2-macroglobulin family)
MIPLGQAAPADVPVRISPAIQGQWRWTDPQTLSFRPDPETALSPATLYTLEVEPGLVALDGTPVPALRDHHFATPRPRIEHAFFRNWLDARTPVFEIHANLPLTRQSLMEALAFRVDQTLYPVTAQASGENPDPDIATRWEIQPAQPLPQDRQVVLMARSGLQTPSGSLTGLEAPELRTFATFPAPRFLGIRYTTREGQTLLAPALPAEQGAQQSIAPADPESYMELVFTSPVRIRDAAAHIRFEPALTLAPPWEGYYDFDPTQTPHSKGDTYSLSLPTAPLPVKAYAITVHGTLSDAFGRKVDRTRVAHFTTDHMKPAFYLPNNTAVLEKNIPSELPLALTNIENFRILGTVLDGQGLRDVDSGPQALRLPENSPRTLAAGIRPLIPESGVISGEITTRPQVDTWEGAGRFLAIVSPWQVVAKIGHFNSLVWVTDLTTGLPVSNVRIRIREGRDEGLQLEEKNIAEALTNSHGIALLPGTAALDPEQRIAGRGEYREDKPLWFLEARLAADLVLFPLDWRFVVHPWRLANPPVDSSAEAPLGHIRAWGLTPQGIYRTGETMDWKLYVRNQDLTGLIPPPLSGWTLKLVDPRDQEIFIQENLVLSAFGAVHGSVVIPEDGAVGRYRFLLSHKDNPRIFTPLSVMVTDFSTAPFRTSAEISAKQTKPGETVQLKAAAQLHAGGAYTDAPVRIRSHIRPQPFSPANPTLKDFYFDSLSGKEEIPDIPLADMGRKLDAHGKASLSVQIPETDLAFGLLMMEAAVSDERGKSVSATRSIPFEGRDRLVGIRALNWMQQAGRAAEFRLMVADSQGRVIPGVPIHFTAERQEVSVVRAKGAGNAYTPRHSIQWKQVASTRILSGKEPVDGVFVPDTPGLWRVTVEIRDKAQRIHKTRLPVWVAGKGAVVWENEEDQRLELIPEKDTLRVGDTARILVKNPFPGATALITVERYGILSHEVRVLEDAAQILELPIGPAALPGCYVSVSLLSPRVGEARIPEEGPDLGKPAFRSGYLRLTVTAPDQRIPIQVKTEKESYKPGEQVTLDLSLPGNLYGKTELCVAVLDSAIFDLLPQGRKHFDPHTGLYTPVSAMDLETYALLTRLLGMQRLDAKGATPAGDGGGLRPRENFRGVAYWNPSLLPDKEGKIRVSFSAPDNLTGWEVLAMAVTPGERMGTGHALFRVNRPTEIRPVMPNFLRKGDQAQAAFSVFNRTEKAREIEIRAQVKTENLPPETQHFTAPLAPWERRIFSLPLNASSAGLLRMEVSAKDDLDGDAMAHTLTIEDPVFLETQALSGVTEEREEIIALKVARDARTDVGGLGIRLSPSRISAVEEPLLFLKDYPYACWEQQLARAMGAALYLSMMDYLPDEVTWKEAEQLPAEILAQATRFQRENGSMAYFPAAGGGENPFLSAFTALIFARLSDFGFMPDPLVHQKLNLYLDTLLRKDLTQTPILNRTSRMMILLARAGQTDSDAQLFERLRPDPATDGLFATALYLEAAARSGLPYAELAPVVNSLLARTHKSASGLAVQDEKSLAHPWLMGSHTRTQAAVLMAMIRLSQMPDAPKELKGYPALLLAELLEKQGALARWQGTQDNLFAAMATAEYALTYETGKVHMDLEVRDGAGLEGSTRFRDIRDTAVRFTRPMNEKDPGLHREIRIHKKGRGPVYYTAALRFATQTAKDAVDNGIHVRFRILHINDRPVEEGKIPTLSRGDRVELAFDIRNTQLLHFIMAEIPLPAGLEAVNPHLATSLDLEEGRIPDPPEGIRHGSPWPFYHQELRHQQVRFFAEELPAGVWRLRFTAQAIAEGNFQMPAPHAQALYRPDIWGRDSDRILSIQSSRQEEPGAETAGHSVPLLP